MNIRSICRMLPSILCTALMLLALESASVPDLSCAAEISGAEYFFDNDPGAGYGTYIPVASDGAVDISGISTDALTVGPHTLYVRFKSSDEVWGIARPLKFDAGFSSPYNFRKTGQVYLAVGEYFIDIDPGEGRGTPVTVLNDNNQVEGEFLVENIPVAGLDAGTHKLFFRVKDSEGRWGVTREYSFETYAPLTITGAEYFIDNTNPGSTRGVQLTAVDGAFDSSEESLEFAAVLPATLSEGLHTLSVRYRDSRGLWGGIKTTQFAVARPLTVSSAPPFQTPTGDGSLVAQLFVDDNTKSQTVRLQVEFKRTGSDTWEQATIRPGTVSSSRGNPSVDNSDQFQIGSSSGWIDTSAGALNLSFVWDFVKDVGMVEASGYLLRYTINNGTSTSSTESLPFALDSIPPLAPVPHNPVFNPTGNIRPSLSWKHADSATVYHIQIASDDGFSNLIVEDTKVSTSSYIPPLPLSPGSYFWRVRAIDALGNISGFSAVQSISIVDDSIPPTVSLSYGRVQPVGAGPLLITAVFSETLSTVPAIAIRKADGTLLPSVPMTGSGSSWSYLHNVECGESAGNSSITISNAFDSGGNQLSIVDNSSFSVFTECASDFIAGAEYFFDLDPGEGRGISLTVDQAGNINDLSISTNGLKIGSHTLYIRFLSSKGVWGTARPLPNDTSLQSPHNVWITGFKTIAAAEYFIDEDPGNGNGTPLPPQDAMFDGSEENLQLSGISTSGLGQGMHTLFVRVRDSEGTWSIPRGYTFEVYGTTVISAAEYFIGDTDPGPGNATPLQAVDGSFNSVSEDVSFTVQTAGLSPGSYKVNVRFRDSAGRWGAIGSGIFEVDPETVITKSPNPYSNSQQADFEFSATAAGAVFECSLESGPFLPCSSPYSVTLQDGTHSFAVRSVAGGVVDKTPATHTWTIDTVPPVSIISFHPGSVTRSTTATFGFSSSEPGTSFQCSLDSRTYESCVTPQTYVDPLADGEHIFRVKGIDLAGNEEQNPATYSWRVDTVPPTVSIDPLITPTKLWSQAVTGSREEGSTVVVTSATAILEPVTYPASTTWSVVIRNLHHGENILAATATDAAGNTARVTAAIFLDQPCKPGDCDGDCVVSISEVQAAINMYLGIMPVQACVDTDSSNGVTISEVQKVINGYLGL